MLPKHNNERQPQIERKRVFRNRFRIRWLVFARCLSIQRGRMRTHSYCLSAARNRDGPVAIGELLYLLIPTAGAQNADEILGVEKKYLRVTVWRDSNHNSESIPML